MKQTRYTPDPKQPYGFHDCHINGMEITECKWLAHDGQAPDED